MHLEYVKKFVGRTPVLFVINKIDAFNSEDEEVSNVIARQTEYLRSKGFGRPIVCPVSSRAAYLSKKQSREELSRIERRELYNYVDKFQEIDLTEYYGERFPSINISDMKAEEKQLLKTCGFRYIEEIIKKYTEGEKVK